MRYILLLLLFSLLASCSRSLVIQQVSESVEVPTSDFVPYYWKDRYALWSMEDTLSIEILAGDSSNEVLLKQIQWFYINKRTPNYLEEINFSHTLAIEDPIEIQATAYFSDGTYWQLREPEITRVPLALDTLQQSLRSTQWQNIFIVPRYDVGVILRVATLRRFHEPQFSSVAFLRSTYAIQHRRVEFKWPKGYTITHAITNREGVYMVVDSTDTTLTLTAENLEPILQSAHPLAATTWYGALHYSIPKKGSKSYSWAQTAQTYYQQIVDSINSDSLVVSLLPKRSLLSVRERVEESFNRVQQHITYLSFLDSVGAFIPRSVTAVLSSGYGDCKEMSLVLHALLRHQNIPSFLALTSLGTTIGPLQEIPALRAFDHMIVGAIIDGDTLLLDPTNRVSTAFTSSWPLLRQPYLPLDSLASLKTISLDTRSFSHIMTHQKVTEKKKVTQTDTTTSYIMQGTIALQGEVAARISPLLLESSGDEQNDRARKLLRELFDLSLQKVVVSFLQYDSLLFTYQADVTNSFIALDSGGFELSSPALFGGRAAYSYITYEGPVQIIGFKQEDTWELPQDFSTIDLSSLNKSVAVYQSDKGGEHRVYVQQDTLLYDRQDLTALRKKRSAIMNYTLWRE